MLNKTLSNTPVRRLCGRAFSILFALTSIGIVVATLLGAAHEIFNAEDVYDAMNHVFVTSVSNLVVALTIFDLALVIDAEFVGEDSAGYSVEEGLRRTVPHFFSTISCALAVEGLVLIIKYNQDGMYENIYIAIAIIISSAILLATLALFLKLHRSA
ncbi:hypothetical protein [Microbulbifer hainanensis]|uniref:hypothetical protein n=1 Tax=Microbulbifer hainanensis TaxID=2735675 RepID=UPI0018666BE1|nr:hypothetical protein [Microbulbifer hainanensis]